MNNTEEALELYSQAAELCISVVRSLCLFVLSFSSIFIPLCFIFWKYVCGVFTVAVDISKMIGDRGYPTVSSSSLLGTSTMIQCYPLVRAFLTRPPAWTGLLSTFKSSQSVLVTYIRYEMLFIIGNIYEIHNLVKFQMWNFIVFS